MRSRLDFLCGSRECVCCSLQAPCFLWGSGLSPSLGSRPGTPQVAPRGCVDARAVSCSTAFPAQLSVGVRCLGSSVPRRRAFQHRRLEPRGWPGPGPVLPDCRPSSRTPRLAQCPWPPTFEQGCPWPAWSACVWPGSGQPALVPGLSPPHSAPALRVSVSHRPASLLLSRSFTSSCSPPPAGAPRVFLVLWGRARTSPSWRLPRVG